MNNMSNKKPIRLSFLDVWSRVKDKTNIKNLVQLAEFTDTSQPTVSRKKKEDSFPVEWAFKIARAFDLNTDWIMTGEEPKRLGDSATTSDQESAPKGIIEEWIQEVREKEGNDGRIVMELALEVKEFREWYREKKGKPSEDEVNLSHQNVA